MRNEKNWTHQNAIEEIFYLGDEESATKLELAYAYVKMNDFEGAKEILSEVIEEGNADQKKKRKSSLAEWTLLPSLPPVSLS